LASFQSGVLDKSIPLAVWMPWQMLDEVIQMVWIDNSNIDVTIQQHLWYIDTIFNADC
jgi:hypothetical protein